jgi:hypothetical protein
MKTTSELQVAYLTLARVQKISLTRESLPQGSNCRRLTAPHRPSGITTGVAFLSYIAHTLRSEALVRPPNPF